jgi:hypothetical protein
MLVRVERTVIFNIRPHISAHDRSRLRHTWWCGKFFLTFFCLSPPFYIYRQLIFPVIGHDPVPSVSKSGRPFNLHPISLVSIIGYNAPTLDALTFQRIRAKTITSRPRLATSRATPMAAATRLIKAFKVITLFIIIFFVHYRYKLY